MPRSQTTGGFSGDYSNPYVTPFPGLRMLQSDIDAARLAQEWEWGALPSYPQGGVPLPTPTPNPAPTANPSRGGRPSLEWTGRPIATQQMWSGDNLVDAPRNFDPNAAPTPRNSGLDFTGSRAESSLPALSSNDIWADINRSPSIPVSGEPTVQIPSGGSATGVPLPADDWWRESWADVNRSDPTIPADAGGGIWADINRNDPAQPGPALSANDSWADINRDSPTPLTEPALSANDPWADINRNDPTLPPLSENDSWADINRSPPEPPPPETDPAGFERPYTGPGLDTFGNRPSLGQNLSTPLQILNFGSGHGGSPGSSVQAGTVLVGEQAGAGWYLNSTTGMEQRWDPGTESWDSRPPSNTGGTESAPPGLQGNETLVDFTQPTVRPAGPMHHAPPEGMTIVGHDTVTGEPIMRDAQGNLHTFPGTGRPVGPMTPQQYAQATFGGVTPTGYRDTRGSASQNSHAANSLLMFYAGLTGNVNFDGGAPNRGRTSDEGNTYQNIAGGNLNPWPSQNSGAPHLTSNPASFAAYQAWSQTPAGQQALGRPATPPTGGG